MVTRGYLPVEGAYLVCVHVKFAYKSLLILCAIIITFLLLLMPLLCNPLADNAEDFHALAFLYL
jgi:hypothetical protein